MQEKEHCESSLASFFGVAGLQKRGLGTCFRVPMKTSPKRPGEPISGETFWCQFWSHFGFLWAAMSGSFCDQFSRALFERPRAVFGGILEPFWFNCSSILGVFWESFRKVKIELSLESEPHFHWARRSNNQCFFDNLSKRPPQHSLEPLLGVLGSILAPFGSLLGCSQEQLFGSLFRASFFMAFRGGAPSNRGWSPPCKPVGAEP